MEWTRDKADWPHADRSRFVDCRPHRWHVQVAGNGPDLLLLHGAGGATQSWRNLMPLLAQRFRVIAPDLPGQGFTKMGSRHRCSLPLMAEDIGCLCAQEGYAPQAIIGHSAGGALALELSQILGNTRVIGLNAALDNFDGVAGWLFPFIAKLMAANPLIPPLLARLAGGEKRTRELLATTGSQLDDTGVALYRKLMSDARHIDGVLAMMARWDVEPLLQKIGELDTDCLLIVGSEDGTVAPAVSRRAADKLPNAQYLELPGLGHLVHEEDPETVAAAIFRFLDHRPVFAAAE